MAAQDIHDEVSLRTWLENQPQKSAVLLSARIAQRFFTFYAGEMAEDWARRRDVTALPILRQILTSGVAAVSPTPEVKSAAAAAARSAAANDADAVASYAAARSAAARAVFWDHVRRDVECLEQGRAPFDLPLWFGAAPDWFDEADARAQAIWAQDAAIWDFWRRWWQGVKSGRPLDWRLQERVALIPDAVWDEGPAAVAKAILDIELALAIANTPNAEVLQVNPQSGLIQSIPVSHLPGSHLADIVDMMTDAAAIFDEQGGPNGPYAGLAGECGLLRSAVARYRTRPLMLLHSCQRVAGRVQGKVAAAEVPKDDALVGDFVATIARAVGDLLAFDPDVREAEEARARQTVTLPSPDLAPTLLAAAREAAGLSEGDLARELPEDAEIVLSDAPAADKAVAQYRLRSRLLRVLSIGRTAFKSAAEHVERYPLIYGLIAERLPVICDLIVRNAPDLWNYLLGFIV